MRREEMFPTLIDPMIQLKGAHFYVLQALVDNIKYQPSVAGALADKIYNVRLRPQNSQWGQESCLRIGFWPLQSTFT